MNEDDYLDARGRLQLAEEFLPLPDHPARLIEPFLHGASIAIELSVKAAMKHGGANEKDCICVGHDLVKAIDAAEARGYSTSVDLRDIAYQLAPYYRTHTLRDWVRNGYDFDQAGMQRAIATHLADVRSWIGG